MRRQGFLAVTQRHFGQGRWPDGKAFAREIHTDDLIAVIKALDRPLHLVGWSYAGAILLSAASELPNLSKLPNASPRAFWISWPIRTSPTSVDTLDA